MTVTKAEMEAILSAALSVHPYPMRMATFDNAADHKRRMGRDAGTNAYFANGVVYFILDQVRDKNNGIWLVIHELGHQIWDSGNVVAGYALVRLYCRDAQLDYRMVGGNLNRFRNVISDIIVNIVNWNDPGYITAFGKTALDKAVEYSYYEVNARSTLGLMTSNPDMVWRRNFEEYMIALDHIRRTDPTLFSNIKRRLPDNNARSVVEILFSLCDEKNLAIRQVQSYYVKMLDLYKKAQDFETNQRAAITPGGAYR